MSFGPEFRWRPSPAELNRDLRKLSDPDLLGELKRANERAAEVFADKAYSLAFRLGGIHRKERGAIKARKQANKVAVGVSATKTHPAALVAFWGAKKRTGWNAGHGGKPQHPKWVGNTWGVGVKGQGPYALNDAIADEATFREARREYEQGIDDLAKRAGFRT